MRTGTGTLPQRRQPRRYGPASGLVNALRRGVAGAALLALALLLSVAAAAAATPPRILVIGDSIAAGYGLPPGQGFPERLQAKLAADGIETTVINGGVSADTTAGGVARLDWALGEKPDYVLLELGGNDMLRAVDPKIVYANLDTMLTRIAESGAKALLIGMKAPANWGADYREAFDAVFPALAAKHHVPLYPFLLDGVALQPALNQPDGLHPNPAGVAIIVDRLAPYVERLLHGTVSAGGAG
jgi:acyl-CoA thioesterase-1